MKIFLVKRIVRLGIKSLGQHKLRSLLTLLGIIFGGCSVIAMLAIGEGASQEAQDQIRQLGSQNIIIESVKPPEEEKATANTQWAANYGLTYDDAARLEATVPNARILVPMRVLRKAVRNIDRKVDAEVVGTVTWHPQVARLRLLKGRYFSPIEAAGKENVCVVSNSVAEKLFFLEEPLGKVIRVGSGCYRIIGIAEDKAVKVSEKARKAGQSSNYTVYIPITTAKSRFGELMVKRSSGAFEAERVELHKIIVAVDELEAVEGTALVVQRLLEKFHKKQDYAVVVPLELLRQAKRTKRIFSIVLGSIAAISLLVGGIGIMNIMLATVTERTREIGVRRALGAKRKDIITQFLSETIILSGTGGVVGIIIGIVLPIIISRLTSMRTIITWWSLLLSFSISVAVGIIFGIYPARRAAQMDPIEALRHE